MEFIYKQRKKTLQIFRNGIAYSNSKILSEIRTGSTYLSSSYFRMYSLTYDYIEDNSIERLRTVVVKNENQESLKPLRFNYNTSREGSMRIIENSQSSLDYRTTGLGSVVLGDFVEGREKFQPVFQERLKSRYKVTVGNGYTNYGLPINNLSTDSGTRFFSGRVLDLSNKITEKDQLISINEKQTGSEDLVNPNNSINQQLIDEITFDIVNVATNQKRTVKVPVKGGLFEQEYYVRPEDDPYDPYREGTYETYYVRDKSRREYISGDFNNDGLIDFLIIEYANFTRGNKLYLVEIGKQNSGVEISLPPTILNETLDLSGKEIYPIEFDGDGVPEFMLVDKKAKNHSVFKIDFISNSFNQVLGAQSLTNLSNDTPFFFGDFNGDGLTDFLTPQKVYEIPADDNSGLKLGDVYFKMETEQLLWWKYVSTGKNFVKNQENYTEQKIAYLKPSQSNYIKKSTTWQKFWNGKPDTYEYTRYSTYNIFITDFNNDGRSDIITLNKIGSAKYRADGTLSNVPVNNLSNTLIRIVPEARFPNIVGTFVSEISNKLNFYENKNLQGGTFSKLTSYSVENIPISPLSLIVSNTEFDFLNISTSGVYIYDPLTKKSRTVTLDNAGFLEKQIQEVDNGSNVLQKIDYRNMIPSKDNTERTYLYNPYEDNLKYPLYTHKSNSTLYLVNKIHTVFDGKILTKEYRYGNGIQHLNGKGFLGFQKSYSSDAYESELKDGKYINKYPVKALFWSISTKDPKLDNAVKESTYGGLKDQFFTVNTIVNKRYDKSNHQYLILPTKEASRDDLKKIAITKDYFYDESDDLKLKKVTTNYSNIGSSVSNFTYKPELNNGDHYYYGKIASLEEHRYKNGYAFGTKEENDYFSNGALKEVRKYGNQPNAPPLVTSYTYDIYGNVKSETLSTAGIASQTTSYDYDSTNRFVTKTTTPDGLYSSAIVSALGRVLEETSPLGNLKTYYTYDFWGNITDITDFLGKKTAISKSAANGSLTGAVYNLHKKREGGTETIVTFDKFDRELQTKTQSINGKWVASRIEYDILGRKIKESEPFFEGETPKWNTVEYDELNRPIKNIAFTGKTITTCYEGMKVTVDDGFKKTSKVLDAMGHVIKHQDHGGTIAYAYYPNGALRESNYEGIKTTFEIDGWGNKTKIIDPSAGTFTYEYDNLSRLTKETSPNGETSFTFDNLGRPLTESTTGRTAAENTNIYKTYTYNGQTKLPETISGTSNGKTFTYITLYDKYYRVIGKVEQTPDFVYTSSTTFDSFGRSDGVSTSVKLLNPSHTSTTKVKNIYDANGILIQQNDVETNKMIWHISSVNSRGNTTEMEYGNGYRLSNTYSTANFSLQKISHNRISAGANILDISFEYDVDKGVLNKRYNHTFNKEEKFTYDKLNRLLTETVNNVLANQYTYDKRGRITSNTELGKYNYTESNYKLQNIAFNANGRNVNAQRGFATVSYNAYKSPLKIILPGKENLSFNYSILKTRYSTVSSVTGKQKYYSSDFAIEITKENNGKAQIVTFVTGDPYSANYIKKTVLSGNAITETGNYFLHRDNLQSIVAITKTDGSVIEKRFFDAWGNLKTLINKAGQAITDAAQLMTYDYFLDRGYTGHEHLWRAGLINMNARLYDPILRKFLSPDNLIQDPFNTQNYDRYSYVLNNPLLYMDVTGNEITIVTAIVVAVAVAVGTKVIANMIRGIPWWYGMGKAATMGAVSGAISFGIGAIATTSFGVGLSFGKAVFEAGTHAITSGLMDAIQGNFGGAGFASALVSSLISSGINALGVNFAATKEAGATVLNGFGKDFMKASMIVAGGFSGGLSAVIAGGKFMDGFRQGLITAGLNHIASRIETQTDYADPSNSSGNATNDANGDVLNWFNEKDGGLYRVAQNDPGVPEGTIRIYAHGNPKGIQGADRYWIDTPEKFDRVLMERSPAWRNYRENGGSIKIELMSCNTGRWGNGFASKLSQTFRFSSVLAPNNYYVAYTRNGVSWGAVAGQYNLINPGRWNYFVNGQNITGIYDRYRR